MFYILDANIKMEILFTKNRLKILNKNKYLINYIQLSQEIKVTKFMFKIY